MFPAAYRGGGHLFKCYNAAEYLEECLASIKNQLYRNFICVIVNDGSTDSSDRIINKYCETDSALSCIHCRARGNALPEGILDEVRGLIRSVSIKDINNLSIKFKRKVLLAFAYTNSLFYLFIVRIAYKIIKKWF